MLKPESVVGVLGATSLVGNRLFVPEFKPLSDKNLTWVAFSRNKQELMSEEIDNVHWCVLHDNQLPAVAQKIEYWICLAPIWVLPDYFSLLESLGARRIVALSSTSRFSKINSIDVSEQNLANRLVDSEQQLINWAEKNKIAWIIVRPTLIYGFGRDQNITTIARFIQRFGFFPLLGKANGLRQPIHVDDVARICLLVLFEENIINKAYNVSGGEILSYKNMVERVFNVLEMKPKYFHLPLIVFRIIIAILHFIPQFRKISVGMAHRMNQDLIFPSQDAKHDLKFEPKGFQLSKDDVGK
ncbi:SDR family oxidoreductase [Gimesia aquarii]|uniref:NAD dependent epimerase/dehydratase family protein n=1 Tax=Gimesia aquarii TaxID=2527964 RepID=A0A517W3U4_9PLAN|nr:NAD-dependent epimerase/dehydratase family protein [Gimesia aquarii]QDT99924.1 NAD dependent epimerase/dehydratase family protein [Gimesia aquarii]